MRFLVDESTGKRVAALLADAGHDAVFAGDIMPSASDEEVLARAESEGRILVSDDKDFGELVVRMQKPSTGVILLRTSSINPKIRADAVLKIAGGADVTGRIVIVREGRIRVRKL